MSRLKERLTEKLQSLPDDIPFVKDSSEPGSQTPNAVIQFPDRNPESNSLVPDFAITLNEARQRIALLQDFVREMMVQGIDFGNIPGCDKPSLLKAGAEKLCDIFGFSKTVEILYRAEDWQGGLIHYEVKVTLTNKRSGMIEAEGLGSCNTKEKKFAKQDPYSILNSILKMAKKRALVDAVLSATRSSGIFTQDMEDLNAEPTIPVKPSFPPFNPPQNTEPVPAVPTPAIQQKPATKEPELMATPQQLKFIETLIDKASLQPQQVHALVHQILGVNAVRELTKKQASEFITFLKENG